MAIALYPGAFKPPHRGHFEVVQGLLKGNHGGHTYTKDSGADAGAKALAGQPSKVDKITKVVIFLGGGERNGITKEESKAIWEIYAKYLGNIEIVDGQKNPMMEAKEYAKAHPDEHFYAVTGVRGEQDFADLRRISTFASRPNVEGLVIPSAEGAGVRATDFRNAILQGSLDNVLDFFPKELSRQEILKLMSMLKQSIIAEMMADSIDKVFVDLFQTEEQVIQEGSSGTAIAPKSAMRSEDRSKLVRVYNQLRDVLGDKFYYITYNTDHIEIRIKQEGDRPGFDYSPYMASILEYMIDQGMNITPLPEVKIKRDMVESQDFFGKTAYYEPNIKEVVLYTEGRHPKDVMRSFVHEMIHHIQNLEGRLHNIGTTNTNEDSDLLELEKEAYLKGNITFRNWEDKIKNENK